MAQRGDHAGAIATLHKAAKLVEAMPQDQTRLFATRSLARGIRLGGRGRRSHRAGHDDREKRRQTRRERSSGRSRSRGPWCHGRHGSQQDRDPIGHSRQHHFLSRQFRQLGQGHRGRARHPRPEESRLRALDDRGRPGRAGGHGGRDAHGGIDRGRPCAHPRPGGTFRESGASRAGRVTRHRGRSGRSSGLPGPRASPRGGIAQGARPGRGPRVHRPGRGAARRRCRRFERDQGPRRNGHARHRRSVSWP